MFILMEYSPVSLNNIAKKEWPADSDPDDYFDMIEDDNFPIEYKTAVDILVKAYGLLGRRQWDNVIRSDEVLECKQRSNLINKKSQIYKFSKYANSPKKFIGKQAMNIKKLYKVLNDAPLASTKTRRDMILYRGFNKYRYHPLISRTKNLSIGSNIITPTFLSTTLIKDIAYRFVSDEYIVWKIIVPKEKLNEFRYTLLSNTNVIVGTNRNNVNQEAEVLLNMGSVLKLIDKSDLKSYTYDSLEMAFNPNTGRVENKTVKRTRNYYIHTYEFQGYEQIDDNFFQTLSNCIKVNLPERFNSNMSVNSVNSVNSIQSVNSPQTFRQPKAPTKKYTARRRRPNTSMKSTKRRKPSRRM